MRTFEMIATGLTSVAILMFLVFNADNVTKLGNGLASNAVTYVGGLATVGR